MPELPEVHTTATILHKLVRGRRIIAVWTDFDSPHFYSKENIKDPKYFAKFKRAVTGATIEKVWRRGKNVLVNISGVQTILIHMKMTGHLLYGVYEAHKKLVGKNSVTTWHTTDPLLSDPFNRFVHLMFTLDNGYSIAFSDMRKFATVKLIPDAQALSAEFAKLGPEPLDEAFDWKQLKMALLRRPNGHIKTVLMNASIVAGIGNIYSDEILWASKIHPERRVSKLSNAEIKTILKHTKALLAKGIDFGGDSMSDYRNPYGARGKFQAHHNVYRRTKKPCLRSDCDGVITRKVIGQRSAHFCAEGQK